MNNSKWGTSLSPEDKNRIDSIFKQTDFDDILDKTVDFFCLLRGKPEEERILYYWLDCAYQNSELCRDNYFYPILMMYVCMLPEDVNIHNHKDMMDRYLEYAVNYINNSQGMPQTRLRCGWLKENMGRFDAEQSQIARRFQDIYDYRYNKNSYGYQKTFDMHNDFVSEGMENGYEQNKTYDTTDSAFQFSKKPMIFVSVATLIVGLVVGSLVTALVITYMSKSNETVSSSTVQSQNINGGQVQGGNNQNANQVSKPSESSSDASTSSAENGKKNPSDKSSASKESVSKSSSSSKDTSESSSASNMITTKRVQARIYTTSSQSVKLRDKPKIDDENIIASVPESAKLVVEIVDDQIGEIDGHKWTQIKILDTIDEENTVGIILERITVIPKDSTCYVASEFLEIVEENR